jgi:hypothetical protein
LRARDSSGATWTVAKRIHPRPIAAGLLRRGNVNFPVLYAPHPQMEAVGPENLSMNIEKVVLFFNDLRGLTPHP